LAQADAYVIMLLGSDKVTLLKIVAEFSDIAPDIEIQIKQLSINQENKVKDVFERVRDRYGFINVIINNAGSGESALPLDYVDLAGF
jgi:short-subunit dehydrogenase